MNPTPSHVYRNAATHRFEMMVDGQMARAEYILSDGKMVLTHTFVPSELRGRGIAADLIRHVLEAAKSEGLKIVPQCSYVATFIDCNPEFKSLVESSEK